MYILHADADAFYASVEQRDDPALRGRPVIVGTGVVMAASYEARAHGVHSGMRGRDARRLCPGAIVVPTRFEAYAQAGRELRELFAATGAVVEPASIEEAFLDVSRLERPAAVLATQLREQARELVGLALTVGGGRTKLVAKAASAQAKPDGLLVLAPAEELAFLHRLPVERVWGIGPAGARRLCGAGARTLGDVAGWEEARLVALLGKAAGRYVHAASRNRDMLGHVRPRGPRRSYGAQRSLRRTPPRADALDEALCGLVERVARRMERDRRAAGTITVGLRFADFERAARARALAGPTAAVAPLLAAAREALGACLELCAGRAVTLVSVSAGALNDPPRAGQLSFD